MNSAVLVGRLTKDVELKYIPGSGTAVATSTIAIDRDYIKKDGSKETDFIPIEVMGKSAEYMANYLGKGRLVAVQGSIRVDNYQDQQGNKKTFTKVSAMRIQSLDSGKKDNNAPVGFEPVFNNDIDNSIPF